MKKFITLICCTVLFSSAFAQKNASYNLQKKEFIFSKISNDDPRLERDKAIQKINYQNSLVVERLVKDPQLNIWEKRDALDALESQRLQKVNFIYSKYNNAVAYYTINERNNTIKDRFVSDDEK